MNIHNKDIHDNIMDDKNNFTIFYIIKDNKLINIEWFKHIDELTIIKEWYNMIDINIEIINNIYITINKQTADYLQNLFSKNISIINELTINELTIYITNEISNHNNLLKYNELNNILSKDRDKYFPKLFNEIDYTVNYDKHLTGEVTDEDKDNIININNIIPDIKYYDTFKFNKHNYSIRDIASETIKYKKFNNTNTNTDTDTDTDTDILAFNYKQDYFNINNSYNSPLKNIKDNSLDNSLNNNIDELSNELFNELYIVINKEYIYSFIINNPNDIHKSILNNNNYGFENSYKLKYNKSNQNYKNIITIIENIFQDKFFESIDIYETFLNTINILETQNNYNLNKEHMYIENFIKSNYNITNNINDKIKSSVLNEIINTYIYNDRLHNTSIINNTNSISFRNKLSNYLLNIGLHKKRFSDGIYYYGLVKKDIRLSDKCNNLSLENIIKERNLQNKKIYKDKSSIELLL